MVVIGDKISELPSLVSINGTENIPVQKGGKNYKIPASIFKNIIAMGIKKSYTSITAMQADGTSPVGNDGEPLKAGDLVSIYNTSNPDDPDNNSIYAFKNPNWEKQFQQFAVDSELSETSTNPAENRAIVRSISNLSEINSTGRYSYIDSINAGNNGTKIYAFICKNKQYKIHQITDSGDVNSIVKGITKDALLETITNINGNQSGVEVEFTPQKDYVGFCIYYGSSTTATMATNTFEIVDLENYIPDCLGDAENIYPDPFIMAGDAILKLPGIKNVTTVGNPSFLENSIVVPIGSFVGIVLDLGELGYNPSEEYLNIIVKGTKGNGSLIRVSYDNIESGTYSSNVNLSDDITYPGWFSSYNINNKNSLSNTCRVTFDNRSGDSEMVIKRCMMWKGKDVSPFGMFSKQAWMSWEKIKNINIKETQVNYAPYYNQYNIKGGIIDEVIGKDTLSFGCPSSSSVFIGYDFDIGKSDFSVGDTIGFGVKNCIINSSNIGRMYCIFYNQNTEISRLSFILQNSEFLSNSGVIPDNTTRIVVRFQISGEGSTLSVGDNYLTIGEINHEAEFNRESVKDGYGVESITDEVVYVDAKNGNDGNPGTSDMQPLATFSAAFEKTGVNTTIILIGDTTENFNIKTKSNKRSVRLVGKSGSLNRIICGTKIDDAILVEGTQSVYQKQLDTFSTAEQFQLFQHEVYDENTLIPEDERHPLQRGKTYRCDSTKIIRTNSLDDVKTSDEYKFFYDTENKTLYFKVKNGTSLAQNPVYIPGGSGVYGNDGSVLFEMTNIEIWYGLADLRYCHGGRIMDCASKYALGAGGFRWDAAIGLELVRCEASSTFSGSGTGDGFNAHSNTTGPALAKHTVATMIDCWSHDNNDDGYSDHERCETTIIGGLFEYNDKGGITPAYGCQDTIYNAYCRKQKQNGIALVGGVSSEEGGKGSQIFAINCICENNNVNYYVSGEGGTGDGINFGKFVNCQSINGASCGYKCGNNAKIELNNCTDKGSGVDKKGNVIVNNGVLVE